MNPSGTAQGMPSLTVTVALDATNVHTNRIAAGSDNNGNQSGGVAGTTLQYDVANRVFEVNGSSYYGYDSDNRRIFYRNASGGEAIWLYGADGRKLTSYTMTFQTVSGVAEIEMNPAPNYGNVYFTGMLVAAEGGGVTTDRIGSVRTGPGVLSFQSYPYGVEYATTANDREKYATYTRDSLTGLDYAMNRYYWSQWGRFLSPDPSGASISFGNPQSWNGYVYGGGDPANSNDPSGLSGLNPDPPPGEPGWGGIGPGFGINPGGGGWGFGFGGGSGCYDLPDPGNWYDGGNGLPPGAFGPRPPGGGQGFLPFGGVFRGGGGGSGPPAPCNSPILQPPNTFLYSHMRN